MIEVFARWLFLGHTFVVYLRSVSHETSLLEKDEKYNHDRAVIETPYQQHTVLVVGIVGVVVVVVLRAASWRLLLAVVGGGGMMMNDDDEAQQQQEEEEEERRRGEEASCVVVLCEGRIVGLLPPASCIVGD